MDSLEKILVNGLNVVYNEGAKKAPGLNIQPLNCPFSPSPSATEPCPVQPADRNVMYENKILGLPRLRMVGH